ncbi:MAG: type II toxin-antitoxin system Phd/YefM family antitoxin [Planctomycetota bacterium]|jgi:prevent-host-death family protein
MDVMKESDLTQQTTVTASEGHRGFGKLLKRVYGSDEHLIIERDGFPVAVMMSYQEYEKLEQLRSEAAFIRFSRGLGQDVGAEGLTEDELLAQVKDSRKAFYKETYGDQAK